MIEVYFLGDSILFRAQIDFMQRPPISAFRAGRTSSLAPF